MTPSKNDLRRIARERRAALSTVVPDFATRIAAHAADLILAPGTIIGGYHPLQSEADPTLLLEALVTLGCHVAYPRVVARDVPLEFHRVPDGEVLRAGAFGIHEPAAHFPVAQPDVLLVPLLAYDTGGHRLGYGGGFYDRTLATRAVRAIGIAYAGQKMDFLPHDAHDYPLNLLLTEQGITRFR